ncbi:hypothetical protein JKP88DRAFT_216676 [Tribonema minus]|uniref:Secreted protein n=1 Tax=Tribonema minus TaxID=303371 RepID=A0A835YSF9_9STRA|nr:hypothetical protein JKP88DRAFT_216676 [Tribonema minus]
MVSVLLSVCLTELCLPWAAEASRLPLAAICHRCARTHILRAKAAVGWLASAQGRTSCSRLVNPLAPALPSVPPFADAYFPTSCILAKP